jgi:hypothetical protein
MSFMQWIEHLRCVKVVKELTVLYKDMPVKLRIARIELNSNLVIGKDYTHLYNL